jgi:hypothetical protein
MFPLILMLFHYNKTQAKEYGSLHNFPEFHIEHAVAQAV